MCWINLSNRQHEWSRSATTYVLLLKTDKWEEASQQMFTCNKHKRKNAMTEQQWHCFRSFLSAAGFARDYTVNNWHRLVQADP